ncbi:unnamed protein product [Rotaria magnacalcarata]|uniref:Uncharacterized protein n=1 Tax=Rotaria magnacalcarata TaxID=392030 RepID=A0A816CUN4_9BILA|nr:unnamed protein product [Rotaria magnacalcarata]CAF4887530.1 unnamed protein product [Rotaria magnacalcarata]
MPISSGFSRDPNPTLNYHIRKPGKSEILDESIYYKEEIPIEKPVEVVTRPIIKETVFLPDRKPPPLPSTREAYTIAPEPVSTVYTTTGDIAPEPVSTVYTTTGDVSKSASFNLIRALGLNADCPCWAWIVIVFGILLLLGLLAMCLYFILGIS